MQITNTKTFIPQELTALKSKTSANINYQEIFNRYCMEVLGSSLLTGVSCFFVATPQVATSLIIFNIFLLALNALTKTTTTFGHWQKAKLEKVSVDQKESPRLENFEASHMFSAFYMSLAYGTTGNILLHEAGHAAAAALVHEQANPVIRINGLFEGSTTWIKNNYTYLGRLLGPQNSQIFISIAGPFAAVSIATIGIILAIHLYKKYPQGTKHLFLSSLFSIILHINYTLLALPANANDLGNDFVMN